MTAAARSARYRAARVGGCVDASAEQRADGSLVLRSTEPLLPYPARLADRLEHWAQAAPDRSFVARRDATGQWQHVTYAQMLQRAMCIGQALVERGLSAERPIAILSGNDIEHLSLAMGALWAGVPYTPVSSAYSLVSTDHAKLKHILRVTTPGLVFANGASYDKAIAAAVPADVEVVLTHTPGPLLQGRSVTRFEQLLAAAPTPALAAAHAATGPDTIVKFLFTSGSTKEPKGVVNTNRMLCANQQMLRQCLAFLADPTAEGGPVLVDWLPWNHTFGGNHNVGIVLYNGGTLYIDDGKPTPAGMAQTLANLREIAPTIYFNVPKGFEEIARAMDHDDVLRERLFSRVQAFMFAGAGLAQPVWDKLDAHAERTLGERVRMITGLGMTETAPSCTFAVGTDVQAGWIGLPAPGVEVKIAPDAEGTDPHGGKREIRFRGPHVMPGYWRAPEQSAAAFDDEGFYCTGDAVRFVDAQRPEAGLVFDGRIAEDFKLSSGTFVSVGPLRARVVAAGDPLVQDSVVAGLDRDDIRLLVFPRADACRAHAGLAADAPLADALAHPSVRTAFQQLADRLWREGTGGANRVAALLVLAEPPSIDKGEVTDKGSINQRAVLLHRAPLVAALYAGTAAGAVLPDKQHA